MDKTIFIKNLKILFGDAAKTENKYTKVWLSQATYGGLYYSDNYIVKAILEKPILRYGVEIDFLNDLLFKYLEPKYNKNIDRVAVYNIDENDSVDRDDIVLFESNLTSV